MSKHIPGLTGVRGIAAVWVVLYHLSENFRGTWGLSETAPFIRTGFLGVDLFFILSGAVMFHVHGNDFARYSIQSHLSFLKLRFARVYPLHAFCLLAFATIVCSLPDFTQPYRPGAFSLSGFLASLLLVNNWGFLPASMWNLPAWSLSAECLGYLAFPLIAVAIRRLVPPRTELAAALALMAALVAAMLALHAPDMGQLGKMGVLRMGFEFSAGCLLYRYAAGTNPALHNPILAFALVLTLVCCFHIDYHWCAVFGMGFIVLALCMDGPLGNLLFANKVALWLGNLSFSLYLSHWPLIQIYQWLGVRMTIDRNLYAILLVVTIVVVAMLLFRFVEMPSRRYLRGKMRAVPLPDSVSQMR
jgi:peptidoglycan/LPS O-acetylase OafA/YrhL